MKQWLQVEVDNEIVMYLLLSFISNLDFKPLSVPMEAISGSVYTRSIQSLGGCDSVAGAQTSVSRCNAVAAEFPAGTRRG